MSKSIKIIIFVACGFAALLVLIAVSLFLFVDAEAYRHRLEATASGALGMEVKSSGRIRIGFFPGLLVTVDEVHIRNRGADVVSAKRARLRIDLLPLLHTKVRFRKIVLDQAMVSIERDSDGTFNFEIPAADRATLPALNLAKVSISEGTLLFTDKQSGAGFEAADCDLDVRRLKLSSRQFPDLLKNLSFMAEVACGEIRTTSFTASDLKFSTTGKEGVIDLDPVSMRLFGGQGSGSIRGDFTDGVPLYHLSYALSQFSLEEFLETISPENGAEGSLDFSANLSMHGKTVNEMRKTMAGQISLRGENLTLNGINLDQEFSRFESSQNFNLVDVGAFFFAGPLGLVVTKGYNFGSVLQRSEGRSGIRRLVSDWEVKDGVAEAQDVAMATGENRIALQGALDLAGERFNDVTVALIDAQGCATVRQKVHGTFREPVVEEPNILKSLAGPVLGLIEAGLNLLPGGECEVFYAGSVELK